MDRAIKSWLSQTALPADAATLTKKLNKSYTIYGSMLLLPPTAFEGPEWTSIKSHLTSAALELLYAQVSKELKITHIAVNKPIPLHQDDSHQENILRSPIHFTPLFGAFGPETCSSPPSRKDFEEAYWVTAKQNGIHQTWAPRWTMFSRGNISEKARLLGLDSVRMTVEQGAAVGGGNGDGCAAVDLYAGIGYFAFSYVKAGMGKVLCWDINPWSVEGLMRGAKENKWKVEIFGEAGGESGIDAFAEGEARLLVFNETNEKAPERVEGMRNDLPPIRHVNCGMLPSSRKSLELAVKVLDPVLGGWLHVHENFLVEEIMGKAEETRNELETIVKQRVLDFRVEIEYINRLKSYAPGVMHCVIDIAILPNESR